MKLFSGMVVFFALFCSQVFADVYTPDQYGASSAFGLRDDTFLPGYDNTYISVYDDVAQQTFIALARHQPVVEVCGDSQFQWVETKAISCYRMLYETPTFYKCTTQVNSLSGESHPDGYGCMNGRPVLRSSVRR